MTQDDIHASGLLCGDAVRIINVLNSLLDGVEGVSVLFLEDSGRRLMDERDDSNGNTIVECIELISSYNESGHQYGVVPLCRNLRRAVAQVVSSAKRESFISTSSERIDMHADPFVLALRNLRTLISDQLSLSVEEDAERGSQIDSLKKEFSRLKDELQSLEDQCTVAEASHSIYMNENVSVVETLGSSLSEATRLHMRAIDALKEEYTSYISEIRAMGEEDLTALNLLVSEAKERLQAITVHTNSSAMYDGLIPELVERFREKQHLQTVISEITNSTAASQKELAVLTESRACLVQPCDQLQSLLNLPIPSEFIDKTDEACLCIQTYIRAFLERRIFSSSLPVNLKKSVSKK